jgi:dihydrofolate reductase
MIRGYIAQSADGYVADRDGGVSFLDPFQTDEAGKDYEAFLQTIDTVVMGRTTYDQIVGFGMGWPYEGKRAIVVTSSELRWDGVAPIGSPEVWAGGISSLVRHLHDTVEGDAWVVGGPRLQSAFLADGHLDRLDLFIMPVFLGGGVRLFESDAVGPTMALREATEMAKGVVKLAYEASLTACTSGQA